MPFASIDQKVTDVVFDSALPLTFLDFDNRVCLVIERKYNFELNLKLIPTLTSTSPLLVFPSSSQNDNDWKGRFVSRSPCDPQPASCPQWQAIRLGVLIASNISTVGSLPTQRMFHQTSFQAMKALQTQNQRVLSPASFPLLDIYTIAAANPNSAEHQHPDCKGAVSTEH
jgi:hypothetical protein